MKLNNKLVSIIIPCYNQAQYLDEALQSVLDQTYTNWECIVVNDGSLDDTEKIAKTWTAKDNRFIYFYKENGGVSSARNFGLEKAKGDYIQFLDADDILDKNKLKLSLNQLNATENETIKIVISNFRKFTNNPDKTTIPYCNLNAQLFNFESLMYRWNETFSIPIHCGFFEATLFEGIRFPENLTAQEDWIVWVNIFKMGAKALFIDKPLALYRRNDLHSDQLKAYEYFKNNLSEAEFHKLSVVLISRYYRSTIHFKTKLNEIKQTNTYKLGYLIKKALRKLGILKPSKYLFEKILKLKIVSKYL
jgi:hypothetical protein